MRVASILIPLSKLHGGRENPRRVKPSAESDQQLVASVRAFGIVQPLVVRPKPDTRGEYQVIAGNRRLKSLRQVYRGADTDPKIRCEVRDVDDATAEAIALAENFGREQMHPLDEAESFARLASEELQGVDAIASAFGVTERYVRQRMRLASLAKPVKKSFREGAIDLAMAMEFASVPEDGQLKAWEETNGQPRHADHVRNIVAHAWVDAGNAMFDLSTLSEGTVSADLFAERTLVERSAFMAAQLQAMETEAASLRESGWREVLVGKWEDLHDRPLTMDVPEREYDEATTRAIEKLEEQRSRWEGKLEAVSDDDERALEKIQSKLDELETAEQELTAKAPSFFSEATKSKGTVFLMLHPDGQVRREERIPRERRKGRAAARSTGNTEDGSPASNVLTSESLSERQLADLFTHQTLAVREALLKAPAVRKRVLALHASSQHSERSTIDPT